MEGELLCVVHCSDHLPSIRISNIAEAVNAQPTPVLYGQPKAQFPIISALPTRADRRSPSSQSGPPAARAGRILPAGHLKAVTGRQASGYAEQARHHNAQRAVRLPCAGPPRAHTHTHATRLDQASETPANSTAPPTAPFPDAQAQMYGTFCVPHR